MIPLPLKKIIDDFSNCSDQEKLEMLLDFSENFPEPNKNLMQNFNIEQIPECQTPLFLAIEKQNNSKLVKLHFYIPKESLTTRGFASILVHGLKGLNAFDILQLDENLPEKLGLSKIVSPLRLRGMTSMIVHIKRKVKFIIDDS